MFNRQHMASPYAHLAGRLAPAPVAVAAEVESPAVAPAAVEVEATVITELDGVTGGDHAEG
jgi:hypothetical protein